MLAALVCACFVVCAVKTLTGLTFTIDCQSTTTVRELQQAVAAKESHGMWCTVALLFAGHKPQARITQLPGATTIGELGITHEATVHRVITYACFANVVVHDEL